MTKTKTLVVLYTSWLCASATGVCWGGTDDLGESHSKTAISADSTLPKSALADAVGKTRYGNPIDGFRRLILDHKFVIQAIESPSPTPQTWRRLEELLGALTEPDTVRTIVASLSAKGKPSEEQLAAFIKQIKSRMVHVRGGQFTMGDWGMLQKPIWPVSGEENDKPPFQVTLESFSLMTYRATFAEYDMFTRHRDLPPIGTTVSASEAKQDPYLTVSRKLRFRFPDFPVNAINWQQARDYCLWLGEVTGQPFDLPTEAQWEYAARSRGKKYVMGVAELDPRKIDPRKLEDKWEEAGMKSNPDYLWSRPVGTFGPNEIGINDTIGYGEEWVLDNYGPYDATPKRNPRGPETGTTKILRIAHGIRPSIQRREADPESTDVDINFRCALNRQNPWK